MNEKIITNEQKRIHEVYNVDAIMTAALIQIAAAMFKNVREMVKAEKKGE